MTSRVILLGVALSISAAMAWAQTSKQQQGTYNVREKVSGKEIFDLITKEGYKPVLGKDSDGDPKVEFKIQGKSVAIFFYDCKKTPLCTNLAISAGWDINKPLDNKKLLAFNFDQRFARASIDEENDPYLESDFDFTSGATLEGFVEWIKTYAGQLDEFESTFKL